MALSPEATARAPPDRGRWPHPHRRTGHWIARPDQHPVHRAGFTLAGDEKEHRSGVIDDRQRDRQPARRFGRHLDGHDAAVCDLQRRRGGEQRGDVAVGRQAEQDDVTPGPRTWEALSQQGIVGPRRVVGIGIGRGHGMDVRRRNGDVIQQALLGHVKVAARVICGHVPLVAPKQVHLSPRHPPGKLGGQQPVQGARGVPPGEDERAAALRFHSLPRAVDQRPGGGPAHPVDVGIHIHDGLGR